MTAAPGPGQMELFTGEQLRDQGVALVARTNLEWEADAEWALAGLCRVGEPFTAADLIERVGMPSHPNKVGAFVLRAARAGTIRPTGLYAQARRPASHARAMRQWEAG